MFWKEVSYAHECYISLIKNTVKTIILWYIIYILKELFSSLIDFKINFIPVLQSWFFNRHYVYFQLFIMIIINDENSFFTT